MQIDLAIKNYRCFPRSQPARLSLRPGFTAFLGVNNSGKSSLLRFFFEFRSLFGALSGSPPTPLLKALGGTTQGFDPAGVLDRREILPRSNTGDLEIAFTFDADPPGPSHPVTVAIVIAHENLTWTARLSVSGQLIDPTTLNLSAGGLQILRSDNSPLVDLSSFVETTAQLERTCYLPAFRNAINVGTKTDYYDIQVGQAFVKAWDAWKTGPSIKQNEATHQLTEDIRRLFGFNQFDINSSPDNQTLQFFINGRSFRLHELGGGIAQFILVLANVAVKQPAFILIDEPELNLHPSLQLDFLTILARHASVGILLATHSIGLARSCANQLYMLRRLAEGESEVLPYEAVPRLSELLGELSFSGYRELGFEQVLLVEGPHDLPTIRQFLRLMKKDHRVVLLPLGGDSMINGARAHELEEVKRICSNVAALIDSEKIGPNVPLAKNRAEFVSVCQDANVTCHVLERRAIENYFVDTAIKKVKGANYRFLDPYQRFADLGLEWSKADNWRIALEMTNEDLADTDLGRFLDSL